MNSTGTGQPNPSPLRARILPLAVLLVVLVTGSLLCWHSLTDIDIWFHLRAGRDLLAGEGMPGTNHYSFTEPDHPWLNHEWLFQVGAAAFGPSSDAPLAVNGWNILRLALGLLLITTLAWGAGLARRTGSGATWTGVALLFGLLLLWPRLTIRPEMISYTCFVLMTLGVERFGRLESGEGPTGWRLLLKGPGLLVLLVTLFWAQCHGFAALAPAVLLIAALLAPLEGPWKGTGRRGKSPRGALWMLVGAALLMLAVTPNGLAGLLFPFRALGQFQGDQVDLRRTVSELVPLLDSPASLDLTIKMYLGSLVWGAVWILARWRDLSLLRIALFLAAAFAAWTSQRNIGLYALTFILLHGEPQGRPSWVLKRIPFAKLSPRVLAGAGLAVMLGICLVWWPALVSDDFYLREGVGRRFGGGVNPARYPLGPATGMIQADRYFANLDAAAFTLAHAPGRIFIDGRTEAYSPARWAEYLTIKRGGDQALKILAGHHVDAVCLATGNPAFRSLTRTLLDSPAWRLSQVDGAGLLFVPRKDNAVPIAEEVLIHGAMANLNDDVAKGSATRRADFCLALSRLSRLEGEPRGAETWLLRGLEIKRGHPTLHHNLGNILMERAAFGEAVGHFEAALDLNPRLSASALNAGVCQARLGDRKTARHWFRRAVHINPRHFEAWMNLASTEAALGDQEAARRAVGHALDLRPGDRAARDLQRRLGS